MSYEDKPQFDENGMPEGYKPLFEVGIAHQNPAIKVIGEFSLCPVTLASLVTGLFESIMRNVPEHKQNEYETVFKKSFRVLMKERHNYEIKFTEMLPPDEE